MNAAELRASIGQRVVGEHKGIQIVGKLIAVRELFGRIEGQIEFPKGTRPPSRWFWSSKIEAASK
jgi:hypothetical protein